MSYLKQLLLDAQSAALSAQSGDGGWSLDELVVLALELGAVNKTIVDALEPIKAAIRDGAQADLPAGEDLWSYQHELGQLTVKIPGQQWRVSSKSIDPSLLSEEFGAFFPALFQVRTTVSLAEGWAEHVAAMPRELQDAFWSHVESYEPTRRVGLQPDVEAIMEEALAEEEDGEA